MESKAKQRIPGLDLLRAFAILFVISGHFSLNTEFSKTIFEGWSMWLQAIFRNIFIAGVPLFIMLTGYLNSSKIEINRKYYKGALHVIVSYVLFSILTILFRKYYCLESFSVVECCLRILDFTAIPYAWYIEMWLGLFILTPFLNILYRSLPSKKYKQGLVISLFLLTALPNFFNRYGLHLIPDFWEGMYPLTYYFIGAYIKEYSPKIRVCLGVVIILLCSLINPVFNALFVDNHDLIEISGGQNGIFGVLVAVTFFLIIYDKKINLVGIKTISLLSLDMYLVSFIFDKIFYGYFIDNYFVTQSQFGIYFFVIVPLVLCSSLVVSLIKDYIFRLIGLNKI